MEWREYENNTNQSAVSLEVGLEARLRVAQGPWGGVVRSSGCSSPPLELPCSSPPCDSLLEVAWQGRSLRPQPERAVLLVAAEGSFLGAEPGAELGVLCSSEARDPAWLHPLPLEQAFSPWIPISLSLSPVTSVLVTLTHA